MGASRGLLGGYLGSSRRPYRAILSDLGALLPVLEAIWGHRGLLGGPLGAAMGAGDDRGDPVSVTSWRPLWAPWGLLGPSWRLSWTVVEVIYGHLVRLGKSLDRLGNHQGPSWPSWRPSWLHHGGERRDRAGAQGCDMSWDVAAQTSFFGSRCVRKAKSAGIWSNK